VKTDTLEQTTQLLHELLGDVDPATAKGRRRRQLLDIATEMFSEQGYRRTSISAVAAKAHIAKATVYLYFATKGELLLAATAWEKLAMLESFRPLLRPELDARARLRGWIAQTFLQTSRSRLLSRLIRGDDELQSVLADIPSPLLERSQRIQLEIFSQLVADATGESPTEHADELRERITAMRVLFFAAPHIASPYVLQGMSIESLADTIAALIVDGVQRR